MWRRISTSAGHSAPHERETPLLATRFASDGWLHVRSASSSLQQRQFLLGYTGLGTTSAATRRDLDEEGARTPKAARVEAVLFVSDSALSARRLAQLATLEDSTEAVRIVDQLNAAYDRDGSAFRVERAANGYLLLTRPLYARWLSRQHQRQSEMKLSPSAMETLTVIAYRQPITRADIEAIRGVQCTEMLKQLMERGLVRIGGEENTLGRPYLYETTRRFLEVFGLRGLDDLPLADRVRIVRPQNQPESEHESELRRSA